MGIELALTSIGLGLLATTSPCVLPLYPGFLAFLAAGQDRRPLGRGGTCWAPSSWPAC